MPGKELIQAAHIWLSCTEYVISAWLLWWISLVHRRGLQLQWYQQCGKSDYLKYEIVAIIIIMDAFHQLFDLMPSTISVHFCLSWAISLAVSKVRFSSWSSFWTAPSHVVLGLPLGRLTFRMPSARACFAGASSGSLNRWPSHSSVLFWIFLLHSTVFVLE